mgnify:CR=1 FL=1
MTPEDQRVNHRGTPPSRRASRRLAGCVWGAEVMQLRIGAGSVVPRLGTLAVSRRLAGVRRRPPTLAGHLETANGEWRPQIDYGYRDRPDQASEQSVACRALRTEASMSPLDVSTGSMYSRPSAIKASRTTRMMTSRAAYGEPSAIAARASTTRSTRCCR